MVPDDRYVDHMNIEGEMPPKIKVAFEPLRYEIAWLHAKWSIYGQLFCRGEEQLDVLNSMARAFFLIVQDSLQNDLIVGLCRITDPPNTGKRKNLTLSSLAELLKPVEEMQVKEPERENGQGDESSELRDKEKELWRKFSNQLESLGHVCSPLREWRNRRLAHSDFPTAVGQHPDPLPESVWDTIDEVLVRVRVAMNMVEGHFLDSEFRYDLFTNLDDGEEVVRYLKEAQQRENEERGELRCR
jgi:hypothetical protein